MKILFIVTGIGYGDSTREHSNIVALKEKHPDTKILVAGYDNSLTYFQDKYETIKIRGYKLPGKSMKIDIFRFGLRNIFLPAFWFIGTLKVRLEAFNFIPDLIVSDFEPVGISLGKVLGRKCIVVFGYDPELYKEYASKHKVNIKMKIEAKYFEQLYNQADIVVIPKFKKPKKRHLLYSYVNPVVRIKPEQLKPAKVLMKELKLKKKPILVMLGGSDFGTKLAKNINRIAKQIKENFIIFGGNLEGIKFSKNITYIRYTPDFLKYLKICKAVITLGGQKTLSEALVYQKPILCYPIKDHIEQQLNAYELREVIMVSHNSSVNSVRETIPLFIKNAKKLQKKVEKMDVQSNGSEEIVKIIDIINKNKRKRKKRKIKKKR